MLELCYPIYNTGRIINIDNYYTSPQLLDQLNVKGLYCRGTVRANKKHVPRYLMFEKADVRSKPRGSWKSGVCSTGPTPLQFVSWLDGNVVNAVSNADSTDPVAVQRQIGAKKVGFTAPELIGQYNQYMQGVDRFDQIRARFSVCDGHTYKKWHKKMFMALIDLARVNAYLARSSSLSGLEAGRTRDPHRDFVLELCSQLIHGKWNGCPQVFDGSGRRDTVNEEQQDVEHDSEASSNSEFSQSSSGGPSRRIGNCTVTPSSSLSQRRRQCCVCRFERDVQIVIRTERCLTHSVSLCTVAQTLGMEPKPYHCPNTDWSCWRKFHDFYLPERLFGATGRVRKGHRFNAMKRADNNE